MTDVFYIIGRDGMPRDIILKGGEELRMTLVCLPGTDADVHLDISLEGEGTDVDIAGLYLLTGRGYAVDDFVID